MKKTLLLLVALLAIASPALARPSRGYCRHRRCDSYRRHCRRPCAVRRYHRSHCWHGSDWGKLAAGAAVGWLVNEALDTSPRREVVCVPSPVYAPPPVCAPLPVYQTPVYQTPVCAPPPACRATVVRQTTVVTPVVRRQVIVTPAVSQPVMLVPVVR